MQKESETLFNFDERVIEPISSGKISKKLKDWFALFPPNQLYPNEQVRTSKEHSLRHIIKLFIYVNYFGQAAEKYANEAGLKFNLPAQEINAIFHDSQRLDDSVDVEHAQRAARKLAELDMHQKIPASPSDIDAAISICPRHNEKPNGNDQMDFNLLFFRWCDGLDWVRYEGAAWESEEPTFKEVTAQFLSRIYPSATPENVLRSFIVSARFMDRRVDYLMKEHNISEDSLDVVNICLESGVAAGFLS